jgi:hypothetical protein
MGVWNIDIGTRAALKWISVRCTNFSAPLKKLRGTWTYAMYISNGISPLRLMQQSTCMHTVAHGAAPFQDASSRKSRRKGGREGGRKEGWKERINSSVAMCHMCHVDQLETHERTSTAVLGLRALQGRFWETISMCIRDSSNSKTAPKSMF